MELLCGEISAHEIEEEIPFLCSFIEQLPSAEVDVIYGWGCHTDHAWKQHMIPTIGIKDWIEDSIRLGIYTPGHCDLIISKGESLKIVLCHECDIHIETGDRAIIEECVSRWLEKGYSVSRRRISAGKGWFHVWSAQDALFALDAQN